MEDRAGTAMLAAVTRERARLLAPAVTIGFGFFVCFDGRLGISLPVPYDTINRVLLAGCALLSLALYARKIGERHIQLASTASLWFPLAATALSLYASRNYIHTLFFIIQVASAGVLLDTPLVLGTLVAVNALGVPLVLRCGGPYPEMFVSAMATATAFALLIHLLMRRALVRVATLNDQLLHAQRMEAVGTLAAGVAHDMNNVLASITSFAELLEDVARPELAQILAQAERGAALTRGLLAFSRRGQYRKRIVGLEQIVSDVVPLLARTLPKTVEIRTSLALADAAVEGDPQHLGQVLINLGVNAAEAMDGKGQLAIDGEVVGGRARLRVVDTGRGMDAATRLRAFEPFFTTKGLGKGTGLGLSTVWGIVEAHGGTIAVASELGRGTTFTIELPLAREPVPPAAVATREPARVPHGCVLVVDDEAAVLEGTRKLLERMGLEVITASDGRAGVERFTAAADHIDLVILDMGMPVMSGDDCFRAIRALRDIPVLIATGYADDTAAQQLVAAGAELIEKPFPAADLKRVVARLLDRA